jgi:transcriptional regulator with XRE-family HTH domain
VDRRAEIRDFLISRRAKVTPEQAGLLAVGGVRRVPGLRREEVAYLAGVSVDYYTQLERGDADGASDGVLNAVARALQLTDAERIHLFDLARPVPAARVPPSPGVMRPSVQQALDAFTGPALVRNRRFDYLAANDLGRAIYADVFDGRLGAPNHVRYVFLDDRARTFFDDWPAVARNTARLLRSEAARDPDDPGPAALIEELLERSAEFRDAWERRDVRLPAAGRHPFHHPLVGRVELDFEAAALRADPALTLLLATAEPGSPSEAALRRLAESVDGRPG